jgi:hypothetical protein
MVEHKASKGGALTGASAQKQSGSGAAQLPLFEVVKEGEVEGLRMGVMTDGRAYMGLRSVAQLCGVYHSSLQHHVTQWQQGKRDTKMLSLLASEYDGENLWVGSDPKTVSTCCRRR